MTVQEFINSFSSKDLNKELVFNYSVTFILRPDKDAHKWNNKEFDEMLEDEGFYPEGLDKNTIIVELL